MTSDFRCIILAAPPRWTEIYTHALSRRNAKIFGLAYCITNRRKCENTRKNRDLPYTEHGAGVHGFLDPIGFRGLGAKRGTDVMSDMTNM